MKEDILNNRHMILGCIQYEVLLGKPVFEAHESFCKAYGNDIMEYKEYDFWYYHFKNGEFDLDHDINKDPKKPELSDMPIRIVEKIIEKLELEDRVAVRKVSRPLCNIVDESRQHFDNVIFNVLSRHRISITFDSHYVTYINRRQGVFVINPFGKSVKVEKEKHFELALNDLAIVLKNPKVTINKLSIEFVRSLEYRVIRSISEAMKKTFESLNHQINAKLFCLRSEKLDEIFPILLHFKPGVLENICVKSIHGNSSPIEHILNSDQWKQAKKFKAGILSFPIESVPHFQYFSINLNEFSIDKIVELKNALLKSPNFQKGKILLYSPIDIIEVQDAFGTDKFLIPGSNDSIFIKCTPFSIEFVKK